MDFEIACTCGQNMLVEDHYVGHQVECPGCRRLLTIPQPPRSGDVVPLVSPEEPPRPAPPIEVAPRTAGQPVQTGYGGAPAGEKKTHGKAVAALVCGILSVFTCPVVLSVVSLVLASQAKQEIRANPDLYEGIGLATAGQACAIVGLVFGCLVAGCFLAAGAL